MKNQKASGDIMFELEKDHELQYYSKHYEQFGWVSLYDTYFPYDDVKKLRDTMEILLSE